MGVKLKTEFFIGLILGGLIIGCAGASFPYKFYTPSPDIDYSKGSALGPDPKGLDDFPFANCAPSASLPVPCIIMRSDVFKTLKIQYQQMSDALQRCQSGGS